MVGAHRFLAPGPSEIWIETMQIFILWMGLEVSCLLGIVENARLGSDVFSFMLLGATKQRS